MGAHQRVLRESYLTSTNMTGFRWFPNFVASLCSGRKQLSFGRVKTGEFCVWEKSRTFMYNTYIILTTQKGINICPPLDKIEKNNLDDHLQVLDITKSNQILNPDKNQKKCPSDNCVIFAIKLTAAPNNYFIPN